jgi:hypothetical protein
MITISHLIFKVDSRLRGNDKNLEFGALFYRVQRLFGIRPYLEHFFQAAAGVIITPAAVLNAFSHSAFAGGANAAVTDVLAGRSTAVTVDVFCLEGMAVFFGPLGRHFRPQFIIILPRSFIGITVRADQPAISDHFCHFSFLSSSILVIIQVKNFTSPVPVSYTYPCPLSNQASVRELVPDFRRDG